MAEYTIRVSYSCGKEEEPYGKYPNKKEAFKAMCMIAATEAYTQNEEAETGRTCTVIFDAAKGSINLRYGYCNTWVHYKVVKVGSENGPRLNYPTRLASDGDSTG